MGLHARLREAGTDALTCAAQVFRPTVEADRAGLESLFRAGRVLHVHDRLREQLGELLRIQSPARRFTAHELDLAVSDHLAGTRMEDHGVWVYYPWSGRLVHLLDEVDFARVRTDRNRNKITREEQELLYTKRIGVIGLSVGQSVSLALALERSFGELRIADHDRLDLSNLNRLRSGVHNLGLPKTVNVAREIAEIDPFLKVTCFHDGITRDNLDRFLTDGGKLDMLVEECDSVDIKILARQRAKAHRIPVVMDTSDRGMIDVERFDLEPERPLLHGLIDHLDPEAAAAARTNEEKLPFLAPIAGMDGLSARMKASMVEVGQSLTTWPQLATGVQLGGALVGDLHRRMALDGMRSSGRWYVDLEELVTDDTTATPAKEIERLPEAAELQLDSGILLEPQPLASPPLEARISGEHAKRLAEAARLAPSADNMQPWRIVLRDGRLLLFHDRLRSRSELDSEEMIPHIGLGMCLENILLSSAEAGRPLEHTLFPDQDHPSLVAALHRSVDRDPEALDRSLAAQIKHRHTDRTHGDSSPLRTSEMDSLHNAASSIRGAEVRLLTDRVEIERIAEICGKADRLRIMNEHGHEEFFTKQIRWSHEEAVRAGDGLDIETLELSATDRVGLRMASSTLAMRALRGVSGGKALEKLSANAVRTASAVALLTMPDVDAERCIEGGRAAERLWLQATQLGLAVHPLSAPIFLASPARRPGDTSLSAQEREEALSLFTSLTSVFHLNGLEPVFMVRLSRTKGPTTRSVRRPLSTLFLTDRSDP